MKKIFLISFIVIGLVLASLSYASAAIPGSGWWSALWVQNTSDFDGAVNMVAYENSSAATFDSQTFDFAPAKALAYDPGLTPNFPSGNLIGFDTPLPNGFEGAVVLSANVPAAGVSLIANYKNGSVGGSGRGAAMYQGVGTDKLATKLLAPSVKHNYSKSTTTLYIQAAGEDADVTVTYTMADGNVYVDEKSIPANRAYLFDPAAAGIPYTNCGSDTNTSPCYGSAIVTSLTPIAGVMIEHPHSGTPVSYLQSMRLLSDQDVSQKLYIPSIKNNFCGPSGCATAGTTAINVGSSPANVTITITVTKLGTNAKKGVNIGKVYTDSAVIQPGENYNFSKWNKNLGGLPEGTLAAAVIESDQPLVGLCSDSKTQVGIPPQQAKVKYTAFADEFAAPLAYAPMVKEFKGIFTGGVTVQNVGSAPDNIIIEYHEFATDWVCVLETLNPVPVGGAAETNSVSKVGNKQFSISGDCTSFNDIAGREYSVKAYSLNGENIIMMVGASTPNGEFDISRYEGINSE